MQFIFQMIHKESNLLLFLNVLIKSITFKETIVLKKHISFILRSISAQFFIIHLMVLFRMMYRAIRRLNQPQQSFRNLNQEFFLMARDWVSKINSFPLIM